MADEHGEYRTGLQESAGNNRIRETLPDGFVLRNNTNGCTYRIIKVLGNGGFGVTYEGFAVKQNMRVAIKEFFPAGITARNASYAVTITGDEETVRARLMSFFKEAQVLHSLSGISSVVKIYDYFYANQTAYYIMEYIQGGTLLSYIEKNGVLNEAKYRSRFQQLMHDVELLHQHGVIHRDISPDNIMQTGDGRFKLIDFGSARDFTGKQNLTINVKRNFAPIEQYSESGQGTYTDVYALAATMYYAFTGKLVPSPFSRNAGTEAEILTNLTQARLSQQQIQALTRALAVKPRDRFQTMSEFEQAYFGSIDSRPPVLPPTGGTLTGKQFDLAGKWAAAVAAVQSEPVFPILSGIFFAAAVILALVL